MFEKVLAAGATLMLAAGLGAGLGSVPAEAKTQVYIGVGNGVGYDGCRIRDSWGRCLGPDRYVDDPYYGDPSYYDDQGYDGYYEPPRRRARDFVSCQDAADMVRERGFRQVRAIACGGKYYRIKGVKRGQAYIVKIRAGSGEFRTIVPAD